MHPVGCQNSKVTMLAMVLSSLSSVYFPALLPATYVFPALGLRCTLSHLYAQFQSLRLTTYIILAYPFPHFSLPVSFPALGMRCL